MIERGRESIRRSKGRGGDNEGCKSGKERDCKRVKAIVRDCMRVKVIVRE